MVCQQEMEKAVVVFWQADSYFVFNSDIYVTKRQKIKKAARLKAAF
jgi:hypothetical protein